MAKRTFEEMLSEEFPGWTVVSGFEVAEPRVDVVSPPLSALREKFHSHGAAFADVLPESVATADGPPERLTESIVLERDGTQLRVTYVTETMEIYSVQG